ncbi:hypothetical protein GGF40_002457, partial [Coemansia sp. RSA 1286]
QPGSSFTQGQSGTKTGESKNSGIVEQKVSTDNNNALNGLNRFFQESYVCPFCRYTSSTFSDQLSHIGKVHPWYSLEEHQGIQ